MMPCELCGHILIRSWVRHVLLVSLVEDFFLPDGGFAHGDRCVPDS